MGWRSMIDVRRATALPAFNVLLGAASTEALSNALGALVAPNGDNVCVVPDGEPTEDVDVLRTVFYG